MSSYAIPYKIFDDVEKMERGERKRFCEATTTLDNFKTIV
jgi:hypothetical protein